MREGRALCASFFILVRITPARAGRTFVLSFAIISNRDHPRPRGKDFLIVSLTPSGTGSPPRVREGLIPFGKPFFINRITPACAGRTENELYQGNKIWDHPRVCGKDCFKTQFTQAEIGSPTHVREERQTVVLDGKGGGITHACAGRTLQVLCCLEYRGDHPRSRGKDRLRVTRHYK